MLASFVVPSWFVLPSFLGQPFFGAAFLFGAVFLVGCFFLGAVFFLGGDFFLGAVVIVVPDRNFDRSRSVGPLRAPRVGRGTSVVFFLALDML